MLSDYWAHHFYDNPKAKDDVVDEDFSLEDEMAKLEAEDDWEIL